MCLLIVLRGVDPEYPIVVAGNRDEQRDRPASPPGLWVGQRRRVLSPRDRRAGGTWLGVNDRGMVAGITNLAGAPPGEAGTTRGDLPHLALDHDTIDEAAAAVVAAAGARRHGGFHLVLCDGRRTVVLRHGGSGVHVIEWPSESIVVTNQHVPGELMLPDLAAAAAAGLPLPQRLALLRPILLDEGPRSGHAVLKRGGTYGTVSSSLIAVPHDPRRLHWEYAAGSPDEVEYRNYGNLGRRLDADA